jgi:hypothetical protein
MAGHTWELIAEGREPRTYTDPQQAGAAFYAADIAELPKLVHHGDEAVRTMARTAPYIPMEGGPMLTTKDISNSHPMDELVRAGYYNAVEQSLNLYLAGVDWDAATPKFQDEPLKLDARIYDDLQTLALAHRERAIQAWTAYTPEWAKAPTFVDGIAGQVVSLEKYADLHFAKQLNEYRYGKPVKQEQAVPAQMHSPSPALSKGQRTMVDQQQSAPQEHPRVAPPSYGNGNVDRATFSRKKDGNDYLFSVKAYDAAGKVLREAEGLRGHELAERFGQRVGFAVLEAKGRSGTLQQKDFNLSPETRLSAARKHPLDDPKQLVEGLRQHADDPLRSLTFTRQAPSPEAPLHISLSGYDSSIARGVYSPEALKGVISDDLHRLLMDPEHIKRGSHCIGPGVVEQTEQTLNTMREHGSGYTAEHIADMAAQLSTQVRESAALEHWARLELGRANAIEQGGPQPARAASAALAIDKQPVDRVTYTRHCGDTTNTEDMSFDVHAYDAGGRQLLAAPGATMSELRQLLGGRNAELVATAPGFRGSIEADQLQPKLGIELAADRVREDQKRATSEPEAATVRQDATTSQEAPKPAQATQASIAPVQAPAATSQAPQQAQGPTVPAQAPAVDEREALRRQILSELAQRYTVRKSLKGDQEYRPINEPERVVFVDRNTKLTTSSNAPDVARTMVDLARAKGWETMHLKGSPEFKAHAWVEATLQGVKVTGYEPTDQDRERLAVRMQDQQKNAIHAPQQAEGAEQVKVQTQATQQQDQAEPAQAKVNREAHVQQLMDVLQLAMRDAGVPKEKRIETAHAARERLDNMKVLPEVRVFDAQVRTQQLQPRTQEHRQQQTQHRSY